MESYDAYRIIFHGLFYSWRSPPSIAFSRIFLLFFSTRKYVVERGYCYLKGHKAWIERASEQGNEGKTEVAVLLKRFTWYLYGCSRGSCTIHRIWRTLTGCCSILLSVGKQTIQRRMGLAKANANVSWNSGLYCNRNNARSNRCSGIAAQQVPSYVLILPLVERVTECIL